METTRFILLVALSLVVLQLWMEWQKDYGQDKELAGQEIIKPQPEHGLDVPQTPQVTTAKSVQDTQTVVASPGTRINVTTDVFHIELDTVGGGINSAGLLKYPISLEHPEQAIQLLYDEPPLVYILQGGILSDSAAPTHEAIYTTPMQEYTLADGDEFLQVPLYWESDSG
ncbi:MAG: membrane protein insertase YidC, partial [Gammaproteobacteria bacterium]